MAKSLEMKHEQVVALRGELGRLQQMHIELPKDYGNRLKNHAGLQQQHESLQQRHESLQKVYESTLGQFPSDADDNEQLVEAREPVEEAQPVVDEYRCKSPHKCPIQRGLCQSTYRGLTICCSE